MGFLVELMDYDLGRGGNMWQGTYCGWVSRGGWFLDKHGYGYKTRHMRDTLGKMLANNFFLIAIDSSLVDSLSRYWHNSSSFSTFISHSAHSSHSPSLRTCGSRMRGDRAGRRAGYRAGYRVWNSSTT